MLWLLILPLLCCCWDAPPGERAGESSGSGVRVVITPDPARGRAGAKQGYTCIYIHVYREITYIYIYIYRERERDIHIHLSLSIHIYIYIYICTHVCVYIYIYRERERDTHNVIYIYIHIHIRTYNTHDMLHGSLEPPLPSPGPEEGGGRCWRSSPPPSTVVTFFQTGSGQTGSSQKCCNELPLVNFHRNMWAKGVKI